MQMQITVSWLALKHELFDLSINSFLEQKLGTENVLGLENVQTDNTDVYLLESLCKEEEEL